MTHQNLLGPLSGFRADVAILYTDFRALYDPKQFPSKRAFLGQVLEELTQFFDLLLIPSFTYTSQGTFHPGGTKTNLGALNRFLQAHPDSYTSNHPMFAYTALGDGSEALLADIGLEAFGIDSVFERLLEIDAVFVHIGRPPRLGNTAMHFVEWQRQVDYREQKNFPTRVVRGDEDLPGIYSAFLRRQDHYVSGTYVSDFSQAAEILQSQGRYRRVAGVREFESVWVGRYQDILEGMREALDANPFTFVRSLP